MTDASEVLEEYREELQEELCASATPVIAGGGDETDINVAEISVDASIELSDEALVLAGAVAALEDVDSSTRLDSLLNGECVHCGRRILELNLNHLSEDDSVGQRYVNAECFAGHEMNFYGEDTVQEIHQHQNRIFEEGQVR